MLKFKICALLLLLGSFAAQAKTIIDAQSILKHAVEKQISLYWDVDTIKSIIKEKINNADEINALESMLRHGKDELLQKKGCISASTLDNIHSKIDNTAQLPVFTGALASGAFVIPATVITIFKWVETLAKTYPTFNTKFIDFATKVAGREPHMVNGIFTCKPEGIRSTCNFMGASLIVAGVSFAVAAGMYKICTMIENVRNKKSAIENNIQIIDVLLEYLHFQRGAATGQ